jgi:hypothetical protein
MNIERFIFLPFLFLAIFSQQTAADPVIGAPENCPVTRPADSRFVPPSPHPAREPGRFWLGTDALWTSLDEDGIWKGIASAQGTRNKFWWWRKGWKWDDDLGAQGPGLVVTGRRIDGEAPPARVSPVTNGKLSTGWAMLVMLELPTSGCWEIVGNYRSESVSMIVWLPANPPR